MPTESTVTLNAPSVPGGPVIRTLEVTPGGSPEKQQVVTLALPDGTLLIPSTWPLPVGAAQDGTDGLTPPAIPGTGIRGWLRSIYDRLGGVIGISGAVAVTNLPATQPVSAVALPLPTGAAADATVQPVTDRFAPSSGTPTAVTASGDTIVWTPQAGKRVRLKWVGLSAPSTNTAPTEVIVKWSGASGVIYQWSMGAPGAFAHGVVRVGAVDEKIVVNLSAAQRVLVNLDLSEF